MVLGNDFTFFSLILISALLPLYIYRKKVFKFFYNKDSLPQFLHDVKSFMTQTFPKVKFSTDSIDILDKSVEPSQHKIIIIEKLVTQYANFEYEKTTQKGISKEHLWPTYEIDSIPKKNTPVKDLAKRKEYLLKRDLNRCSRCAKHVLNDNSTILMIKDVENGGTYHFENLALVCNDCNRIINSKNPSNVIKDLAIYDQLLKKYVH